MAESFPKVVLITGGSSGIGRAAALRLADMGADVALVARTASALQEVAAEVERRGRRALALPADVTDPAAALAAVSRTVEAFGRLDVLVCSAGVSMRSTFADTDLAAIEQVMRVNFFGTLYPTYHAIPHVKQTGGSLVAIASLVGKRATPTYAVYGASKFAVRGLYDSLRQELAADGVHVGVLSPGHVETPLRDRVLGPDGRPWATPPTPPFRVWPVDKVVERLVRLLVRRQAEALLPGFVSPMLALDQLIGPWLGDRIIARQFGRYPLPERP